MDLGSALLQIYLTCDLVKPVQSDSVGIRLFPIPTQSDSMGLPVKSDFAADPG